MHKMATTTSMMMIIVMMFLFIGSVAEGPPYNLYLELYPCLNCAKWCEDDPQYTCNYTCKWLPLKETIYQNTKGLGGVWGSSSSWPYLYHKYPKKLAELEYHERRKFELETCKNDKDVNCIYRTDVYPLCSLDFKPLYPGMERCCEIFKKCRVTGYYDTIIEERIHVDENCYKSFPKGHKILFIWLGPYEVERHLKSWMYYTPSPEDELIRKLCYMECSNGRLVYNHSLSLQPLMTTLESTSLSTTTTFTEVTTKKPSTKMLPASTEENKFAKKSQTLTTPQSTITTKIDKTEAFSQVIAGFIGINFVVVTAVIVGVIAELI